MTAPGVHVQLRNVTVSRPAPGGSNVRVLDVPVLDVPAGQQVAIMGPGGAGKSTLARVIAQIDTSIQGDVFWVANGMAYAGSGVVRPVVLVPQRADAALSCTTVREEVGLALALRNTPATELDHAVHEALAMVGLDGSFLHRDPLSLSGGERRRVALAAALAVGPGLLVLDEPSAGLDAQSRDHLIQALQGLHSRGIGTMVITHDAAEARLLAQRLIIVDHGRIAADAPIAELLARPELVRAWGIEPEPHVLVASAVAQRSHLQAPVSLCPNEVLPWVAHQLQSMGHSDHDAAPEAVVPHPEVPRQLSGLPPAPRRSIDPRVRIIAFVATIAITFLAPSLLGVGVVLAAVSVAAVLQRQALRSITLALRPVLMLLAGIIILQAVLGGDPNVQLAGSWSVESGVLWALQRSMQVCALIIAGLLVSAGAGPLELAAGIGWLLAPLRIVRLPVADLALVVGIGASAAGSMADELVQMEDAQRARGIEVQHLPVARRVRVRTMLVIPLLVMAMRRARHMAEALALRGFVRGQAIRLSWREGGISGRDAMLIAAVTVIGTCALVA
jgi:energy-coupling factor transporter ATP-binding protein EcfA2/energy-coupling factor transporter transmembrane protein EcfT